jgi:hypothetical protein
MEGDTNLTHFSFGVIYRRPIKAALAAVTEHLSGLLPLHLVYSQAHENAVEVC